MWSVCAFHHLSDASAFLPTFGYAREDGQMTKRAILAVAAMALNLLIACGVALAE
jgi:phosphoribosylpyrophosphate synthetase